MLWNIFCIAIGAALGANLRYGISLWASSRLGLTFPYGTLLINVLGSFFIGLILTWGTERVAMPEATRLFWVTGLLGGFTTFSTFSFEAMTLVGKGQAGYALLYVTLSTGVGLLAAFAGSALARMA